MNNETLTVAYHRLDIHSVDMRYAVRYKKSATVTMRVAEPGERLATVLSDGTVETERILAGGECIVRNPLGKEYAVPPEKFSEMYSMDPETGEYQAQGVIFAIKNPTGLPVEIMAPWGEVQRGDADCWIAQGSTVEDRYLIGAAEFQSTYTPETIGESILALVLEKLC